MVTIKDISKKTGYSITTVSKALNNYQDISEKARQLICKTAEEMRYLPNATARSLVTKRSWTIGVVFEERTGVGITHPFYGEILDKFKSTVEVEGYDILFISQSIGRNANTYLEHCIQKGVDGIIILCSYVYEESIQQLIESEIPSVVIDYETEKTNCVYTDNYESLYNAVNYLIEKGHKEIAHIYGDLISFAGSERLKGYQKALTDNKIPVNENYIFEGTSFSFNEGYRRGLEIVKMEKRPTAITAASDSLAVGVIKALRENGIRIPEDISIIGFDNIEISALVSPALTTINQDKTVIANEAAKCLIKQIEGNQKAYAKISIKGTLVERDTVAKK